MSTRAIISREDDRTRVRRSTFWFRLFGGAGAWTMHLMLAYGISEFGCVGRWGARQYGGFSLVAWLLIALTMFAAATAISAALLAYPSHGVLKADAAQDGAIRSLEEYASRASFMINIIFTFIILFEGIPILFFLRSC